MSTITADIDGQTFAVDLHRITGLDALAFRHETGTDLDPIVLGWTETGGVVMLADLAIVKWLWYRQNVDPATSLVLAAASVPFLAETDEPAPAEPAAVT